MDNPLACGGIMQRFAIGALILAILAVLWAVSRT